MRSRGERDPGRHQGIPGVKARPNSRKTPALSPCRQVIVNRLGHPVRLMCPEHGQLRASKEDEGQHGPCGGIRERGLLTRHDVPDNPARDTLERPSLPDAASMPAPPGQPRREHGERRIYFRRVRPNANVLRIAF